MVFNKEEFNKISHLARERSPPLDLKFLLFFETMTLRVSRCNVTEGYSINEIHQMGITSFNRGKILSAFTKIEGIIDEILVLKTLGFNKKRESFENFLSEIPLAQKIKWIRFMGYIDKKTKEKLWNLKDVRNGFAHKWSDYEIYYKETPIRNALKDFLEDMELCWVKLKEGYTKSVNDKDIAELITYLESLPHRDQKLNKK